MGVGNFNSWDDEHT